MLDLGLRPGHRGRDVVEFQIQEIFHPNRFDEEVQESRPLGHKEFQSHLEEPDVILQQGDKSLGFRLIGYIQRENQARPGLHAGPLSSEFRQLLPLFRLLVKRQPRPEACLYQPRRAPEPYHENVHAPVYPVN